MAKKNRMIVARRQIQKLSINNSQNEMQMNQFNQQQTQQFNMNQLSPMNQMRNPQVDNFNQMIQQNNYLPSQLTDSGSILTRLKRMLDKLPKFNSILPNNIDGPPPEFLDAVDFSQFPPELQEHNVVLTRVDYKKPPIGKVAKNVSLYFEYQGHPLIKVVDIEYMYQYEQYLINTLTADDILIDESILAKSPNELKYGDISKFRLSPELPSSLSIKSYTTVNDHRSTTPIVSVIIQAKNVLFDPSDKFSVEYFTKKIDFELEFALSDVDSAFITADELGTIDSLIDHPEGPVHTFVLNFHKFADMGFKAGTPKLPEGFNGYDLDNPNVPVLLPLTIYGVTRTVEIIVKFMYSYNEHLLTTISEKDITIVGLNRFISTDDPLFNENSLVGRFIGPEGVEIEFKKKSLVKYLDDKTMFSGIVIITAGSYITELPFDGKLGQGSQMGQQGMMQQQFTQQFAIPQNNFQQQMNPNFGATQQFQLQNFGGGFPQQMGTGQFQGGMQNSQQKTQVIKLSSDVPGAKSKKSRR